MFWKRQQTTFKRKYIVENSPPPLNLWPRKTLMAIVPSRISHQRDAVKTWLPSTSGALFLIWWYLTLASSYWKPEITLASPRVDLKDTKKKNNRPSNNCPLLPRRKSDQRHENSRHVNGVDGAAVSGKEGHFKSGNWANLWGLRSFETWLTRLKGHVQKLEKRSPHQPGEWRWPGDPVRGALKWRWTHIHSAMAVVILKRLLAAYFK